MPEPEVHGEGEPQDTKKEAATPSPSRRFARAFFEPSRSQLVLAIALFLLGVAGAVQVRAIHTDSAYASASRDDLVNILDGLGQSNSRLQVEINSLQTKRGQLASTADRAKVARQQAEDQIKALSILAGTVPVTGPGLTITLGDPKRQIQASNLLDAIEELRDAGAEAIAVNGSVRVVASTSFVDTDGGIVIDARTLQPPYVLTVIGDPTSLSAAVKFPGGLVEQITGPQVGGTARVQQSTSLTIRALHTPTEPRYARTSKPR